MISVSKGLGYVVASAALIFALLYVNLRRIYKEVEVRKASESALEEAQQIAQVGSFTYDPKTETIHYSEEAARILDLKECSMTSDFSALLRRIHNSDRERVYSLAFETFLHGGEASFTCRILRMNDVERTIQVLIHAEKQENDDISSMVGTLQDITERMQAESAARENEAIYKALINSSYDLVYLKDSSLRYIAVNSNMQRHYNISEDRLLGKTIGEVYAGKNARIWEARDRSVLISGKPLYIEEVNDDRTYETIIFPVDMTGNKRGVGGISRDITQRCQTEAAVISERDRAQAYFDVASIIFVVLDRDGVVSVINQTGCEVLGLPKEQIVGSNWIDRFVPEGQRIELKSFIDQFHKNASGEMAPHENDILTASGEIRRIEWRNTILHNADGSFNGLLAAGVDVTELRHTMEALSESERSKSVLLSNLPGMAYRCAVDRDWTMKFASSGCFELTGYLPEELIDNSCISFNEVICPEYREPIWNESVAHLSAKTNNRYEYEIMTASGERKWVLDINQAVTGPEDQIIALEGIIIDITQSKLQFLQIQYLSNHDQLTGLHNRQYYDNARRMLDEESHLPLSVIFVDINRLKLINDAFGYDAGDKMIQTTAAVLKANILKSEIVARVGGDEFGILLPNTDAAACAERVLTLLDAFDRYNAFIKDRALVINLSVGYSTKTDPAEDFAQVENEAEANMARRKLFDMKSHHNAVLTSIMATLFERSFETEEHAKRIGELCEIIGERLGLSQNDIDKLRLFAILHDIGKIGISDQILNKPGPLDEDEMAVMRLHPEIGYRIAMASPDFASVADLILTHQERWDGSGYPNHIAGENIPLLSRILAVADAYDAMTKDRVYRKAMSAKAAMEEIRKNAGTQFDPKVAEVFLQILQQTSL